MIDRNDEPPYPTDAISLLKTDHRKIKNLFARYESAGNFRSKHLIAAQVFTELALHAQLEEHVFYPAYDERTGAVASRHHFAWPAALRALLALDPMLRAP